MDKREIYLKNNVEIRNNEEGKPTIISGFIPYESKSFDLGFIEIIKKGAFTKTIKEADIRCLWNHDSKYVLGRTKSGSLTFEEREDGVEFSFPIPDRQYATDLADAISSGDVDGVSFGFEVIKDTWNYEEEPAIRELLEVRLIEVSVGVTFPAYPESKANVRSNEIKSIIRTVIKATEKKSSSEPTIYSEEERNLITHLITNLSDEISIEIENVSAVEEEHRSDSKTLPTEEATELKEKFLKLTSH